MTASSGFATQPLLQTRGISKSFEGNRVLSEVDLTVLIGEIHAVVGENGAGKSTFIKILGGVHRADEGHLTVSGEEHQPHSPRDAIRHGVVVIHQEFSLTPHLSAEENVFLGHYPVTPWGTVNRRKMRAETLKLFERLSVQVDPAQPVGRLSVAQQQMVEIAKALSMNAKLLILDEPTAVLDEGNVATLFSVLRRLREQGLGIIYISHHLEEVFEIADRVSVLRDGELTGTADVNDVDQAWLVSHMIGRDFPTHENSERTFGEVALEVKDLSQKGHFEDVSFRVRQGEIIGLAGLVGAGRSEVAQAIVGASQPTSGQLHIFGDEARIRSPSDAAELGIAYVTEDRKSQGLFLNRPTSENVTMSNLKRFYQFPFMKREAEKAFVHDMIRTLDIRLSSPSAEVRNLSGGNQQKVVIARALAVEPRILILDEPTRGVDIGAKQEIYAFIEELVTEGIAIVLISSELEEILRLADRIVVLRKGRVAVTLSRAEASENAIMRAAALADQERENGS